MATRSWNRVELIGNLTRDPELRYTPQGTAVVTFSIATNRTFVSDGERKEEADFHKIVAWNKLAELCSQLLKKGLRVFVSGRLQNRSWETQDGQNRQTTEIVIEDMIVLSPLGPRTEEAAPEPVVEKTEPAAVEPEPTPEEEPAKKPKEEAKEKVSDAEIDDLPF